MIVVFAINIFLYFFIQLLRLWYLSKHFGKGNLLVNPFTIIFLSQLPVEIFKVLVGPAFILDEGLLDKYYNFAILVTSISLLIDYLLLRFSFIVSKQYTFVSSTFSFNVRPKRMLLAAFCFYLLYFFFFFLLANHSFGFFNWIVSPRTGYQFHRTGAGQFWVFAISALSVSFTLCCIYVKRYSRLFFLLLIYTYSAFLLGSKGLILEFFIFFLIVLWIRRYRRLNLIFFLGLPAALAVMLVNFLGGNFDSADIEQVFSYFDYYTNSAMYYKAYFKGQLDLFYGKIFLTEFWGLVPRGLYPEKPYVYGITHVNEYFWPGAAEATNTPAFGGPVSYFADFGILGVIFFTILSPFKFIYYFFLAQLLSHYKFEEIRRNSVLLYLFLWFTAPFFLFSLPFPINLVFFLFVLGLIMILNRLVAHR